MVKRIKGMKMTPQRMAIIEYLEGNMDHPSASDVYKAVSNKFPTISLATVYNTIEKLKEKGCPKELLIDPDKKRFDSDIKPHNHLICIYCKNIKDIKQGIVLELSDEERQGFKIIGNRIEFYGICPDCEKRGLETT